ncbi:MAG: hypothetical protein HUU43_15390 [Ignavibacteriaceae bacterium]|nr:hypothetical protein [Ignavibacteriaceae bacterium]
MHFFPGFIFSAEKRLGSVELAASTMHGVCCLPVYCTVHDGFRDSILPALFFSTNVPIPTNRDGVTVIMAVCIFTAEKRFSSVYVAVCFLLSCVLFSVFLSPVSCLLFPVYTGFNRIVAGYSSHWETQALRLYRNLH